MPYSDDSQETLREWFATFTKRTGETPEFIVAAWDSWRCEAENWPTPDGVVPFASLMPEFLDRRFDAGFGGNYSPNFCAWSPSWVLFSDNYDGAEHIQWVPRNPVDHAPIRPGGG